MGGGQLSRGWGHRFFITPNHRSRRAGSALPPCAATSEATASEGTTHGSQRVWRTPGQDAFLTCEDAWWPLDSRGAGCWETHRTLEVAGSAPCSFLALAFVCKRPLSVR